MAAKGIIVNHADDLFVPLNNHLDDDEDQLEASGIEGALDVLSVNDGSETNNQKVNSRFCLYSVHMLSSELRPYTTPFIPSSCRSCRRRCQD
jgi:hypothetical protein